MQPVVSDSTAARWVQLCLALSWRPKGLMPVPDPQVCRMFRNRLDVFPFARSVCVCVKNIDSFVGLTSQRGVSAFADSKGNMWCSHRARCSYRRDVCVVASRLLCPADLVRQSTSWASVSEFRCEEHSFPASPTETRRSLTKLRSHLGVGTGRSS